MYTEVPQYDLWKLFNSCLAPFYSRVKDAQDLRFLNQVILIIPKMFLSKFSFFNTIIICKKDIELVQYLTMTSF